MSDDLQATAIARARSDARAAVHPDGDRLGLVVAVLLALLGVLGAMVAWRMASAGNLAGNATRDALLAQERNGAVEVTASISALDGFGAWLDYETARYRGAALFNVHDDAESIRAYGEAAGHWAAVPREFLDLKGDLQVEAYQSSLVASGTAGRAQPAELLARAVTAEAQTAGLGTAGMVLAAALPLLTAAEVVSRRRARLGLAGAGMAVVAVGVVLMLLAWG